MTGLATTPVVSPIWNVPHNSNPNFTGRESLLNELREGLTLNSRAALVQALHGLGGVGKTQIAIEYVYRYCIEYNIVWWIRSEKPETLITDYARLAIDLGLKEA